MTIGVFDSGRGGLSVANAIAKALPQHQVLFRDDSAHLPYGTKPMDEVLGYAAPVLQSLVDDGADCIVVACNTVSTNLIAPLRQQLAVPLVAVEPMIKPAAKQTKSGVIAVCATPATLASSRYAELKRAYAANVTVLEPDCADWAALIEQNSLNEVRIRAAIEPALQASADMIVLGCTHYHWIEREIKAICAGEATVIQPEQAVMRQLQRVLQGLD